MNLSIVIVNWNSEEALQNCVRSIKKSVSSFKCDLIIVDNNSTDKSVELVKKNHPDIKLIVSTSNMGFAGGNNLGIREALKNLPDYILLINNDTIVAPDALQTLVDDAIKGNADIATGKIFSGDSGNILWYAGGWIDWFRGMGRHFEIGKKDFAIRTTPKSISFISGCMMLVKRSAFEKIGLLDETFFMYHEDVDFCIRAEKAGLKMTYIPKSIIWHKGGGAIDKSPTQFYYFLRNALLIVKKYASPVQMLCFISYAPIYYTTKVLIASLGNKKFIYTFICAVMDGIAGRSGKNPRFTF